MKKSSRPIRLRFLIALIGNGIRAVASFSGGVLVARGLGVRAFGELSFLNGTFNSLKSLLDLGASTAFYTFISRGGALGPYLRAYLAWLAIQFVVVAGLVGGLLPSVAYDHVWLGYPRALVLLAFLASFMQLQVWTTVTQVGESKRETLIVQIASASIALAHLGLVWLLIRNAIISVTAVFGCIIAEYAAAAAIGVWLFRRIKTQSAGTAPEGPPPERSILRSFMRFCRPLMLSGMAGAAYDFGDRWMLQRFGGAVNQGIYQAAYQFAAISLFATTSILQVLWKEFSDAFARGAQDRLAYLYVRVSKCVVVIGAAVSGFLIPWSAEIIRAMLGREFKGSGAVLGLLFLYPVHQALGQVTGTLAFATGETWIFSKVTVGFTVISLVLSYLLQAPMDALVPGLAMGAMGLAIKTVGLNIISVNTLGWLLARRHRWKFDWTYQFVALAISLALGIVIKWSIFSVWRPAEISLATLAGPLMLAAALFAAIQIAIVYRYPALVGFTRNELVGYWHAFLRRRAT